MANTKITTNVIAADAITGALIADNVALGGNPTTTTQSAGNDTTRVATTAFVTAAIDNLVDSAPGTMNTLNEIAAALNDDANFNTTVTNSIAAKLPLAGGTLTGDISLTGTAPVLTAVASNNSSGLRLNVTGQSSGQLFRAQKDGSTKFEVDYAGNTTLSGTLNAAAGSASLPSLSFDGDPNTGIYSLAADNLGFAIGGTSKGFWSASQFNVTGNGIFSGNGSFGGTLGVTGHSSLSTVLIDGVSNYTGLEVKGSGGSRPQIKFSNANNGVLGSIYGTEGNAVIITSGTSGTTGISIDSSQRVGIGTDSPGSSNDYAETLTLNTSGNTGMTIRSGTSSYGSIRWADGTSDPSDSMGIIDYNHSTNSMRVFTANEHKMTIHDNPNASEPLLELLDTNPWIDMKAPDGTHWKSGITMRGGSSSTQGQAHFHMTRDASYRTLSAAGNYDAYIDTTTANSGAYGHFLIGTDNVMRAKFGAEGKLEFYGKHQGDSVGHFIFSNQVGGDGTSTNCTLMVKNGNCQVQIMPWSTLGARIGTRGGGWSTNSNNDVHFTRNDSMQIKLGSSGPVDANGNSISSDERLKKNIVNVADGQLEKINALKVREFEWKNPNPMFAGKQEGFIAQEVEAIIPEAVKEEIMPPDPGDTSRDFEGDVKLLRNQVMNARLIKAVQELSAKLEAAEARITTLEG